jgi:hypothetical protein
VTHLSMEQLLAVREPGLEPGVQAHRAHVESCPACAGELDRLDQRIARMKAVPTLRPARDGFAALRERAQAERQMARFRRARRATFGGLAAAAAVTVAVFGWRSSKHDRQLVQVSELRTVIDRSRELENAISHYDQDRQVVDGRTASITTSLEDRLARLDRQIEVVDLMDPTARPQAELRLWRERVELLNALMDVHVTGARYVGF